MATSETGKAVRRRSDGDGIPLPDRCTANTYEVWRYCQRTEKWSLATVCGTRDAALNKAEAFGYPYFAAVVHCERNAERF